jgi:hypothetical protein
VATASKVTVSGLAISGITGSHQSTISDYALDASSKDVSANITAKTVTVAGLTAANKTYDGTDLVSVINWGSVTTGVGTETLALNHGSATFSDPNANTGKTVTASGYALANGSNSGLASNYELSATSATTTADIAKAALTVRANDDAKFVTLADNAGYNGASYSGYVNGETDTVLGGTLAITRNNNGTNVAGNYSGVLVPGGLTSSNYTIAFTSGNYTIIPADKLLVRVNNLDTTYGSAPVYSITSAQYLDGANVIHDLIGAAPVGNTFSYSDGTGGSAVFTLGPVAASLGTSGNIRVGSYAIGASNITESSANFSNALTVVGNLSVDPKALTASASGVRKTYDGTTAMNGVVIGLTGMKTNDVVTTSSSGAYNQKDVGSNLGYTISGIALNGSDAGNYYLSAGNALTGNNGAITPAVLSVTANNASKTFNGRPYVGGNGVIYAGFMAGESNADLGGSLTYGGNSQGALNAGSYVITPLGLTSGNYAITFLDGVLVVASNIPPPPPPPVVDSVIPGTPSHAVTESNPALPESGGLNEASISDSINLSVGDASAAGIDGIEVTLERKPNVSIEGIVTVSIPKKLAYGGSFFSIPLPADVVNDRTSDKVVLTMPDGSALPDWLSYDPVRQAIVVHQMPSDGLPIKVVVIAGSKHTMITIIEKLQGLSRL